MPEEIENLTLRLLFLYYPATYRAFQPTHALR